MRFDYRGMGDSEGDMRTFESIGNDVRAAMDAFFAANAGMTHAVLWGLCDAASAAIFYAPEDRRVAGLVLLNPWVHTEEGSAMTFLRHYYLQRLASREFWLNMLQGHWGIGRSLVSLAGICSIATRKAKCYLESAPPCRTGPNPLPVRMREGLVNFDGSVLLILSGKDFTALEFRDLVTTDPKWQAALTGHNARSITIHHECNSSGRSQYRKLGIPKPMFSTLSEGYKCNVLSCL